MAAVKADEIMATLEAAARERQAAGAKEGGQIAGRGRPKDDSLRQTFDEGYHNPNANRTDQALAELFGTNRQYVSDAKKLMTDAGE